MAVNGVPVGPDNKRRTSHPIPGRAVRPTRATIPTLDLGRASRPDGIPGLSPVARYSEVLTGLWTQDTFLYEPYRDPDGRCGRDHVGPEGEELTEVPGRGSESE